MDNRLYDLGKMDKKLKKYIDEGRYIHTQGVMHTCACLAMVHEEDLLTAQVAGLLHDCAKCMTHEERLLLCEKYEVEVTPSELENKALLHAKAGAILAKTVYDVEDIEILHAIAVHTTGEQDMSMLDKIIYIADYIEPGRDKAPNLEYVRKLAYQDLDACMAKILDDTLEYLQNRGGLIDPTTAKAQEYYQQYRKEF